MVVVLAAPSARADEADDLIAQGIELRTAGKDEEALAVFRRALERSPSPRARAQVALAEQALGLWVSAETDLVAALATDADPWIAKNRTALDGALAVIRRHLGSLEVRGPAGAHVQLDGRELGALPREVPFRVEAGTHRLEVAAAGHHTTSRSVEIPAGGVARETVTLVPVSEAPPQARSPEPAPREVDATTTESRPLRLVGWVIAGTGVGLLAAGGVAQVLSDKRTRAYNAECVDVPTPDATKCADHLDARRSLSTVAISAFVGGGVLTLGGLTLVLLAPKRTTTTYSRATFGCSPGSPGTTLGLACVGRF